MRIVLDPVPLVIGIYAYVGAVLGGALGKVEDEDGETLGRRLSRQRAKAGDREAQKMVRALHADVKVADKLLKKTTDVWKISQETDLVDLVIVGRNGEERPQAYVLLKPREVEPLLRSILSAAKGAGEEEDTLEALANAAKEVEGRMPGDYVTFGFDPWEG